MNDYYNVLEISSSATQKDIKKAYRRLAKKYHPDMNASKDAAARFKEVSQAYDVLSCPERRNHFDKISRCKDVLSQGSFTENVPIKERNCSECKRIGWIAKPCQKCQAVGHWYEKKKYGKTWIDSKIICTSCKGFGRILKVCNTCAGTGKIIKFDLK